MDRDNKKYSSNILALVDAVIVGIVGMVIYYIATKIPITALNTLMIPVMIIALWCGSMVGYDKVTQLIKQIEQISNVTN